MRTHPGLAGDLVGLTPRDNESQQSRDFKYSEEVRASLLEEVVGVALSVGVVSSEGVMFKRVVSEACPGLCSGNLKLLALRLSDAGPWVSSHMSPALGDEEFRFRAIT